MGYRVAEVAWERGADVVLISGPVALHDADRRARSGGSRRPSSSRRPCAPSCRRPTCSSWPRRRPTSGPATRATASGARIDGALAIPMEPTDDILRATRAARKPGSVIVGFALETGDALAKGRAKLERKDLDLIVVNDATRARRGVRGGHQPSGAARPGRARPASCRSSRSARWPRRSSTPWSGTLADEWRRYLAQQAELGGAEIILGHVSAREADARAGRHPPSEAATGARPPSPSG